MRPTQRRVSGRHAFGLSGQDEAITGIHRLVCEQANGDHSLRLELLTQSNVKGCCDLLSNLFWRAGCSVKFEII